MEIDSPNIEAPTVAQPILGPLAKQALRAEGGGQKRLKLLVLIAAYADAGEPSPTFKQLHARLPFLPDKPTRHSGKQLDALLSALVHSGHLDVDRQRAPRAPNVYTLRFDGAKEHHP